MKIHENTQIAGSNHFFTQFWQKLLPDPLRLAPKWVFGRFSKNLEIRKHWKSTLNCFFSAILTKIAPLTFRKWAVGPIKPLFSAILTKIAPLKFKKLALEPTKRLFYTILTKIVASDIYEMGCMAHQTTFFRNFDKNYS